MKRWYCLVALLFTGACPGPQESAGSASGRATGPDPLRGSPVARGAPHVAQIASVALSPDGSAAVTVDFGGGMRLWPTLDGAEEPIALPTRGARQVSLARAGDGSFTIALVDAAGTGHVLSVDRQRVTLRAQLAPLPPWRSLDVVAGGDRIVALGRDHVLSLLDRDGAVLARLERRGFRPMRVCASQAGDAFLAVGGDAMQRVRLDAKARAFDGDEVELGLQVNLARIGCSPDAHRLAVLHDPRPARPVEPVRKRRVAEPPPAPKSWPVIVFGPKGEERRHEVQPSEAIVGFVTDEHILHAPLAALPSMLAPGVKEGETLLRLAPQGAVAAAAIARGRWVGGEGGTLRVARIVADGTIPESPFVIGYGAFPSPDSAALSSDGALLAWSSTHGELFVEEVGRPGPPRRLRPRARWAVTRALFDDSPSRTVALALVDDERLVIGGDDGSLQMIDLASGERVAYVAADHGRSVRRMIIDKGLVYLDRVDTEAVVYELDAVRGFVGPYPFSEEGGYFAGVGGSGDGRVVWRHDGQKQKICALPDLRSGACRPRPLENLDPARILHHIDAAASQWSVVTSRGSEITIERAAPGAPPFHLDLPGRGLAWMIVSPRADLVAVHGDTSMSAIDVATGKPRWSAATLMPPVFSSDGARVAVGVGGGVAVLDAATGAIVHRRCGAEFGVLGSGGVPTIPQAASPESPSLCE